MNDVVLVAARRSAIGQPKTGCWSNCRPDDLLTGILIGTLESLPGLNTKDIGRFFVGCALQEGEQGMNLARTCTIAAGLPKQVFSATINSLDCSSMSALEYAYLAIAAGGERIALAGGVESMSRIPIGGWNPSPSPRLMDVYPEAYIPAGIAAENLARRFGITREEQDAYARFSYLKADHAREEGFFDAEILPFSRICDTSNRDPIGRDDIIDHASPDDLEDFQPAFLAGGTVTRGNSAPYCDGAAVLILTEETYAREHDLPIVAKVKGFATAGAPAEYMGLSASESLAEVLVRHGVEISEAGPIELHETSAAQVLACLMELGLDPDDRRLNACGGGIALGNGLGSTGARLVVTLAHRLAREDAGRYGVAALPAIGGMGSAVLLEKP